MKDQVAFKRGQRVYSIGGGVAEYVTQAGGEHIVFPILVDGAGEEWKGDPESWPAVFTDPPIPRLEGQASALNEEILSLRKDIRSLNKERDEGILTQAEHDTVNLLAQVAIKFREIISNGPLLTSDYLEATRKIHDLQTMILSQAAARTYPEKYRLLGGTI